MKKINESFFENIDSEIKAYLLGFYLGDGCITGLKEDKFSISLNEKDKYIVQLFRDSISPQSNIGYYVPKHNRSKEQPSYHFRIQNKNLCNPLILMGWGKRKTYKVKSLPMMSLYVFRHFLRGYFDADGSVSYYLTERKSGRQIGYKTLLRQFTLDAKDKNILEDIVNVLSSLNIKVKLFKCRKGYVIRAHSLGTLTKLYDLLYIDSNYYLQRKKDSFIQAKGIPSKLRALISS